MANIPQVKCIYKITSPSGKIYIGQAINARRRFLDYKSKLARSQPGLNNSFKKHGWDKHTFAIIHELPNDVTQDVLNKYECLYMEIYKSCGFKLLNVKEGGSNGRNSDESIKKANDKWKIWYQNNPDAGRKWIDKSVEARKGGTLSDDHKSKIRLKLKGRIFTEEHKLNHSNGMKGTTKTLTDAFLAAQRKKGAKYGGANKRSVNQFSIEGEFIKSWASIMQVEKETGITKSSITRCLRRGGKSAGGYLWKYESDGSTINPLLHQHNHSPLPKKVIQLSKVGQIIHEWPSQTAAGGSLGIPVLSISRCARGLAKSAGGFIWKYK